MRRHGVLRDRERPGDVAGREAFRFMLHQQPEDVQPGRLGQRGERENGVF